MSSTVLGASLAPIVGEGPAAVLLVDLGTRSVVHANPVADQLAPGVRLPVHLDTWSDAAALRDLDGTELSETHHPLSRVLRAEPVMGQAVTAGRGSELGEGRAPLWVVALPMREARELENHALVVLLPMPDDGDVAALEGAQVDPVAQVEQAALGSSLRERALMATGLSFTVADARAPDLPLVWVNPAFTRTTGYSFEESVGRSCRFLQGPGTDAAAPRAIREALGRGEAITTVLLNYTKDGLAFWNQVTISPIFAGDGELTHFVGIQGDVSGRIEADRQRDRALAAERLARADAEAAQGRLRLLAEATTRLSGTLDVEESRARLIDLVVPSLADWLLVLHLDDTGRVRSVTHAHRDPDLDDALARLAADLPRSLARGPIPELLTPSAGGRLVEDLEAHVESLRVAPAPSSVPLMRTLGSTSAISVPLPGRRDADDVMLLVRGPGRDQFSGDDLDVAVDLGRRVGLILDNTRLYSVQQHIALTLQRSLLTDPPELDGIDLAACYRAVESGAEVGGDFYEVIALPQGKVGVAVGDVVGHDVYAAAAMGQLKGVLRACAYDAAASPRTVLERVDELLSGLGMPTLATVVYAELTPAEGGWWLTWSCAGHPPLLVRDPAGEVEVLGADMTVNDPILGVAPGPRPEQRRWLPEGSVLLAYTDGLVERRGEVLDVGIRRLADAVRTAPDQVGEMCDHLLGDGGPAGDDDDVVVLALHLAVR